MNFNTMLDDVYNQLGSSVKTQLILPDPILEKNTVRIVWKNCKAFLKITKTSPEHFFDFMRNQIDKKINIAWFSESISEGLIIHDGRTNIGIMSNKIVALMKKYIEYYVICKICDKSNTIMVKDNEIRKWKIKCECGAEYSL